MSRAAVSHNHVTIAMTIDMAAFKDNIRSAIQNLSRNTAVLIALLTYINTPFINRTTILSLALDARMNGLIPVLSSVNLRYFYILIYSSTCN
jgi:hypothetical protein